MKKLYVILFAFLFVGCVSPTKDNLIGVWRPHNNDYENTTIDQLKFTKEYIEIIDKNEFWQTFHYEINNKHLTVSVHSDSIVVIPLKLSFNKELLTFDSLRFCKSEYNFYVDSVDKIYELIDISTNTNLNHELLIPTIHFYKSKDNLLRIRCCDRFVKFRDIDPLLHAEDGKHRHSDINVFIGRGIRTNDLINLYYSLILSRIEKVNLILENKSFMKYGVFQDNIEIWVEDYLTHLESTNKPLMSEKYLKLHKRKDFITKDTETITMKRFFKIENIDIKKKYLLSMNKEIPIKDYIEIKKYVKSLRDSLSIDIFTEMK